ncbi:hypothetical protein HNQ51_002034 [Inhella inkyongensis]|uniref:SGNH/GDSL hydrolase family protein n=1 Tax=Inhella inkyongensis TaxID=392593 RepID=A0A840S8G1_9BURK|nr:hypothetical protein [Inhella inkyongensis]MBB5204720.1 hypothetical protein [Inhella inkyongensis]
MKLHPIWPLLPRPGSALGLVLFLALSLGLASCGGGASSAESGGSGGNDQQTPPSFDYSVLMMGNSHTSVANLPLHLTQLLRAGLPGMTVTVAVAPDWMFLDEHLNNPRTMALLNGRSWRAVVLQAQKYSSSGQFSYSTQEAEQLVKTVRSQGALPVLFPEWPRLGIDETERIYALHVGIAQAQPACVTPVGQAWDLALQRSPSLRLHSADGNHANEQGAFLTALTLYASITGQSPRGLPNINTGLSAELQTQLRTAAADTLDRLRPRPHCPDQPLQGSAGGA